MTATNRLLLIVLLCSIVSSCGKGSTLEGMLVDAKGQPLPNVKLTARQIQPVKNFEQFETITNPEGIFRFTGLYPASEYAITPHLREWTTPSEFIVQSASEGQKTVLPAPFTIRYMISQEGLIVDSQTSLMWAPAPDSDVDWSQADTHARNLKTGGFNDWRLPSMAELRTLYDPSAKSVHRIDPAFGPTTARVWSGETSGLFARFFFFGLGIENANIRSFSKDFRVLAVRNAQ